MQTPKWNDRLGCSKFIWYELQIVHADFCCSRRGTPGSSTPRNGRMNFSNTTMWARRGGMMTGSMSDMGYCAPPAGTVSRRQQSIQHPEGDVLTGAIGPALEREGYRWPSEQLASRFMFECTRPSANSRHFMFRLSFNFPFVLKGEQLIRARSVDVGKSILCSKAGTRSPSLGRAEGRSFCPAWPPA